MSAHTYTGANPRQRALADDTPRHATAPEAQFTVRTPVSPITEETRLGGAPGRTNCINIYTVLLFKYPAMMGTHAVTSPPTPSQLKQYL